MNIKAVIFDVFETLVTLTGNRYLSRDMATDAGIPVDVFQKVWWESEYDRSSGKRTSEECIADTLKRVGRYSDELCGMIIKKRIDTKKKVFEEESLHSAVIPMLKALKEKGIKIAVISNCYNEEAAAIRNSCLFPYIDVLILSCEHGVCKPEKLIYDSCLAELKLAPGECLYVGDGGSRELEMAGETGMHPVQAAWYLREDSGQPCSRLPGFIQVEDPMEITELTDTGTDINYVPLYVREKKRVSVVFTDLDGTLLRNDKTISGRSMDILRRCREKGIKIVVCSARPERAVTMYEELGIADALITLNGAGIRIGDKVINNGIDHETGAELLEDLLADEELIVTIETSDGIYGNVSMPEWGVTGRSDLPDLLKERDLYKILVSAKEKDKSVEESVCGVIDAHGLDDKVYYSVSEGWLYQIMARSATKYNGAKLVLDSLGTDAGSAVYFGDDNDDCECITGMGLGIAVSNAIERVLKAADAFAPSNEEDGVAAVLERLLENI
ncbi:MAG: HAD-IA family hydrolase [Lachnospiraceae bacterium]|nr:HAD-IA family hydrolase [Lachnospiraceae bacterium]